MGIVFCDIETTGLDPDIHAIIEIALIKNDDVLVYWLDLTDHELGHANSVSLAINKYYDRLDRAGVERVKSTTIEKRRTVAVEIAQFTAGHVLAGNNVQFDQQFLSAWMRRNGATPVWDYHIIDIPTYAAGWLQRGVGKNSHIAIPFKSRDISKLLEMTEPEGSAKHTALADARWSKSIWEKVHG